MLVRRLLCLLVPVAVLAAGCGDEPDGLDELRNELEARERAEAELAERLEDLESRLDGRREPETVGPGELEELANRVEDLAGEVSGLDDAIGTERRTREEVAAELEATAGDLRSTLTDVQGQLETLRGQLDDLRVRVEILQERVDEQDR